MAQRYEDLSKEDLIEQINLLKRRKKFGIVWEDKPEAVVQQCCTELPVLTQIAERAITEDPTAPTNLIIEGDNYHTLSVLNYTHAGKIDLIYIDPPYNTGNKDFIYNDSYVEKDDTYRHSKWLSFIFRRITLARNLLKESGAIFISINENEFAHLKLLCDEIFGEENYLTTFTIKVRHEDRILKGDKDFHEVVEYLLLYRKSAAFKPLKRQREKNSADEYIYEVRELIKDPKTVTMGNKLVQVFEPGQFEVIKGDPADTRFKKINIRGSIKEGNSSGRFYMRHLESLAKEQKNFLFKVPDMGDDATGDRYFLTPKSDKQANGHYFQGVPQTRTGTNEKPYPNFFDLVEEFNNVGYEGGVEFRNGKKPIAFIEKLLEVANCFANEDAIVLDFFAGSGSTGHALLNFNKTYGGSRNFILCTNNENNIVEEVTYPRIRNVILGYKDVVGIPANVRYFKSTFVKKSTVSDDTRAELVDRSVEMICVRESTFDSVKDLSEYKIHRGQSHVSAILFNVDALDKLKKELSKIGQEAHIYIFTLTNDTYAEDFADLKIKYKLCPIPESILEVYRKVFNDIVCN